MFDANVLISYLLSTRETQTVHRIVSVSLWESDLVQLVAPPELMTEVAEKIQEKPFLRTHIAPEQVEQLFEQVRRIGERPSPLVQDIPSYTTDADDDYLIVHGLTSEVDYLVTGDRRLRSIDRVRNLQLVTPSEFISVLQEEGLIERD